MKPRTADYVKKKMQLSRMRLRANALARRLKLLKLSGKSNVVFIARDARKSPATHNRRVIDGPSTSISSNHGASSAAND